MVRGCIVQKEGREEYHEKEILLASISHSDASETPRVA